MSARTYTGITPEIFGTIKTKLAENGLELTGTSGSVSKMGVSLSFSYDETASTLALTNVEVGFPASFAGYTPEKILDTLSEELKKKGIK